MKSFLIFIAGFIAGIFFWSQCLTLYNNYETWRQKKLEPVLVEISGAGDQHLVKK